MAFNFIKPQIDRNNRRYENGKKGGAPKGNTNAGKPVKKQPKNNQKQPNVNENVNDIKEILSNESTKKETDVSSYPSTDFEKFQSWIIKNDYLSLYGIGVNKY